MLGSIKDSREDQEQSGIYKIKCSDCEKEYYGQTKRKLEIRKAEHEADCRKKILNDKKPLAKHAIENNHRLGPIELVKEVRKAHQLDTYESFYLFKNKNRDLINVQIEGNNPSILYKFIWSQFSLKHFYLDVNQLKFEFRVYETIEF